MYATNIKKISALKSNNFPCIFRGNCGFHCMFWINIYIYLDTISCDKVYQKPVKGLWFSSCTPVFSNKKGTIHGSYSKKCFKVSYITELALSNNHSLCINVEDIYTLVKKYLTVDTISCDKVYQKPVKGLWFSSCTPVFSTNKTAIIELKYCWKW
jgi:hypothetical protein